MKKISYILIGVILITLFTWLLFRGGDAPLIDTIRDGLPFGSGDGVTLPSTDEGEDDNEVIPLFDEQGVPTSNLFRLSEAPVAGAGIFTRSNRAVVRYVDRATGHIYEMVLPGATSTPLERVKITNTTMPKIYEAYFRPDGTAVLLRSLKSDTDIIENMSLTLTPPTSTSTPLYTMAAAVLRGDIGSVAVGTNNALYYSLQDSPSIVSSAFNGSGLKTILSSAFTDWRLATGGNNLIVYTKASTNVAGFAYILNPANGALTKLLGPLNGLAAIPDASGTRIVYSYNERGKPKAFAKNVRSEANLEILPVTLAEKCVWSMELPNLLYCATPINGISAGEPDNWYQGRTLYSDQFWVFDTDAEIAQILIEPKASHGLDLDVVEPKLSPAEDYLIFMNKRDSSLWALKLESF